MAQTPTNPPTQPGLFDAEPTAINVQASPVVRTSWGLSAACVILALAGLIAFLVVTPTRSPEETNARRAAVTEYAALYRVSIDSVDKFCKVRSRRLDDGQWLVDVSRFPSPGKGGFHVTATFKVDREGHALFQGRSEGRVE